ncbi:molecular chaperone [Burkholderia vietnamiensis]|uniref:hypothetical protein n=1 Tax=Burkholderia vietnamiensis TaxID=60552 RepID=UPI00075D8B31|nr:hypothetical protein [Burkholderia vietnamiensis]TPQ47421.1 hypothetical protein C2U71_04610 [Burkholderia ubonensis]KVE92251.1 molecular chaperone [Burkholderia vietnamiensis]KVF17894.1 molecular chaperone [Burkholderia vietnamiensis]MBR8355946.1 hypothetical protein [Burkholderia vietnamiensis]CAG9195808.1 Molecular chaperone [Burkholderia vietnamiensis]
MSIVTDGVGSTGAAPVVAAIGPAAHRSSQIGAGPQYVADVLGRFAAEPGDTTAATAAATVTRGYN